MQLKYCRKCYAETDDMEEEDIHNFIGCDFVILSESLIKLIIGGLKTPP